MTRHINTRSAKPSEVKCPTCKAAIGEKCIDLTRGGYVKSYHQARRDVARLTFLAVP